MNGSDYRARHDTSVWPQHDLGVNGEAKTGSHCTLSCNLSLRIDPLLTMYYYCIYGICEQETASRIVSDKAIQKAVLALGEPLGS